MNVTFKPTGMYSPAQNQINRQTVQNKTGADEKQKVQESTTSETLTPRKRQGLNS